MAKIEDLIAQIRDERLRNGIAAEVKALKKTKKFGLVFEEHLPETVRLPRLPIKAGELVALKRESGNEFWRVISIHKGIATCKRAVEGYPTAKDTNKEFPVSDLVAVRNFGDPIYPALVPVDRVERGGQDKPWHLLINSDNFHALQLLLYCYEGQVDVIYIDPPYNTGARDWKYNNDYVDETDAWRHSKWLSMMKKRLLLAKRLLKRDGVLVVTIDDYELQNLTPLLSELGARSIGRVSICIKPEGRRQSEYVMESHEYALFVTWGKPKLNGLNVDFGLDFPESDKNGIFRWEGLMRRDAAREDRGSDYWFPFFVLSDGSISTSPQVGGTEVWPINTKGIERVWLWDKQRAAENLSQLKAEVRSKRITVYYKRRKLGRIKPTSFWYGSRYNANAHGTRLVEMIVSQNEFDFPKSLYSVLDCVDLFLPKTGLVLDFFAGSGTTLHATAMLNADDTGKRRCILITNNEVKEEQALGLNKEGFFLGDSEFEKHGICESVTWPRCRNAVTGKDGNGVDLRGKYLNNLELKNGFEENIDYFRLDFLDPSAVARGDAFESVLPILWMMSGCRGKREDSKGSQSWLFSKHAPFAVLIKEKEFRAFREKLEERKDIEWAFLVTDSEENFGLMRRALGRKFKCVQLYKSYLENFRLNTPEALGQGGTE